MDELFYYEEVQDSFVIFTELPKLLGLEKGIILPKENKSTPNTWWFDYFEGDNHHLVRADRFLDDRFKTTFYPVNQRFDGFTNVFSNEVFFADSSATYFGGMNGILCYDLSARPEQTPPPETYIHRVQSTNQVWVNQYSDNLPKWKVPYRENDFSFEFVTPSYHDHPFIVYQYRLVGYQDEWSPWTKTTSKEYTNLSEGSYQFEVRAKDSYARIGKIKVVPFQITPPLYRTWWAYLIYVIAFLVIGNYIVRRRSRQLRLQNQQLEVLVGERTQTIQQQANELKELNEVKSRFFANISHELRTPLTLILSPVDDLLRSSRQADERNRLLLIKNNGQRLLKLINQLLDLSKLDEHKLELHAAPANLVAFARQLTLSFHSLAEQKGVQIDFVTSEETIIVLFR